MEHWDATHNKVVCMLPWKSVNQQTLLTRSFCLSGGESGDTGSSTNHFSVTGWRSTPDKGSLIFTLTSNLPPVDLRPSITYTHTHTVRQSVPSMCLCVCVVMSPTLTSMISLNSQWFSRGSSFSWAVPTTLSFLNKPLQTRTHSRIQLMDSTDTRFTASAEQMNEVTPAYMSLCLFYPLWMISNLMPLDWTTRLKLRLVRLMLSLNCSLNSGLLVFFTVLVLSLWASSYTPTHTHINEFIITHLDINRVKPSITTEEDGFLPHWGKGTQISH